MNLRHQETFCIVLLISTISITLGHDFQFASEKEEEEVQPMLAEPLDVVSKAKPIKSIYSKEKAHCHETQNRIILSLVLRSHSWDEIVEKKRQKAVNKLSKFFLIPKENFVIDDVNRLEVHQMTTNAIRRGRNNLNSSKRKLGRIGFLIGCDKTIFPSEKLIANTIAQQMKERALDDISGLDFGWWSIWTEHPEEGNHQQQQQHHYHQHRQQQQRQKQLLQGRRVRRQTSEDDYDNDDDDYDYNYDDEDEAEPTEIPQHAHRHHHGDGSTDDKEDESAESLLPTSLGTPLTEAEQTGSTAAASTISITSAGLIPTETGPLEQVRIATTTSRTTGDFQLGEDHYSEEVPAEESTEDEYEDTVIITELPNSVAPVVSIATSTAIPPTIRTVTSTETVMAEREPDSTTIEPIGSSTTISPTSSSSFSATITTTQAPLPSPTATTTTETETETASTTPLELITVPRVVFVDATTTPAITTTTSTTTSTATPTDSDSTTTSFRSKATTPTTVSKAPAPIGGKRESNEDTFEENYDDEYDDELEEELPTSPATPVGRLPGIVDPVAAVSTESTTPDATTIPSPTTVPSTSPSTTIPVTTTTTTNSISTEASTTASTTVASTASTTQPSTTELDEPTNLHPIIRNRIPKQAIIAGKVFSLPVPLETFYDAEDGNNLRLELFDSHGNQLKNNSWVQFNVETREIYGLPLEKDVSKWHYILQAVDSGEQSVNETVDVSVQQHKSHRSVNHEISLALRLQRKFARNVDWQIEVIRGIAKVLGDVSLTNIVVREVRNSIQDPNLATFVYTNETLPKDRCPEEKLEELVVQLTEKALNDALNPDILVKSVQGQQIGQCLKSLIPKVKPTQTIATKNFAPTTRNQVDRVNATVGHLLVYKVPIDTFYDPEDGTDLKLKLLTTIRSPLDQYHWLQFDSKNHEFFGIPRNSDIGQKEYLLMAEDREGLTATDALVVVVHQAHPKRDHSVLFELTLDTTHEQFSTAQTQRRFIERLAQVFGDANTNYIQIRNIRTIMHSGQVQVAFYNTTLYRQHQRCPNEEIESMRNILMYPDGTIRAKVREILGQEFSLQNVSLIPVGTCQGYDTPIHVTNEPEKTLPPPIAKDDYLLTFVLPAVIILTMLLIAFIIACILYRRRLTGKMELGTDEERKSFRSKGIPVIFQDELDEKPEIGNKSPVILKDEKPPLLPPSYSSTNNDGENDDLDEYVPPPAVVVGGRESRGKSPVTPSYRRPPPYVSP